MLEVDEELDASGSDRPASDEAIAFESHHPLMHLVDVEAR
jgi:hypothetical protein